MVQKLFRLARKNLVLVSVLVAGLAGRIIAAPFLNKISGGDFFNFLLITKELVSFHSPFIAKRLPFYPLLLIPGHLSGYPIGWAKLLGVFCSLGILVVLYLLGRQLKIKREVLYLALVFTAFQPTLFIYSLRPLTHTLFTFEVLLSLYLFYSIFSSDHDRGSIRKFLLFGVVLGITSMTRHEGFVVAAALFCISAIHCALRARTEIRYYVSSLIVFLVIVTPYFISNYLRFGNFLYSGYAADPGLNRVSSLQSFFVNFEKVKWIILNLWGSTGYFPIKWVLIPTVSALLAFVILRRRFPRFQFLLWGILALLLSLFFILHSSFSPLGFVSFLFACAMILGGLKFVTDTRWRGVPLLLVLTTQTILLMVIQPWVRHLQHTFPFWALFLGMGLSWMLDGLRGMVRWPAIVILSGVVLFNSWVGITDKISEHNRGVLRTASLFEAVDYGKNLEGLIGFETDFSLFRYTFGEQGRYYLEGQEVIPINKLSETRRVDVEEQMRWIKENDPAYVVRYYLFDIFSVVEFVDEGRDYADNFELVKRFNVELEGINYWTEVHKVVKE